MTRLATLVVVSLAVLGLAADAHGESIKVAATVFPTYDIVREVAGAVADVVLVLPPGASPHTFEPAPSTVRALAGARVLFVVGHGLDDWAARLARGAGVTRLVALDGGIALRHARDAERGRVDPHYWLSAPNAKTIARTAAGELIRLAPDRRAEIDRALASYALGQMFVLAPLVGIGSVLAGLMVSSWLDVPSGAAIVAIAGLVFLAAWARVVRRTRLDFGARKR